MLESLFASLLCAATLLFMRLFGRYAENHEDIALFKSDVFMSLVAVACASLIGISFVSMALAIATRTVPIWEEALFFVGANLLGYYSFPILARLGKKTGQPGNPSPA